MDLLDNREIVQVAFQGNSCVKKVVLNRPHKLNAFTYQMLSQMMNKLKIYENDSKVRLLILKANGTAFCAGGDVVALYNFMTAGHWSFGASFFQKFSNLEYLIATHKKPMVALINGMVMGGGAGLSMLALFKIVTENTVFAMPEAAIGSYVVGETYFLSGLPGYLGEYLGLTGARLDGAEMLACGLATHFVHSKDLQLLENELSEVAPSDTIEISQLISKFIHTTNLKESSVISRLEIVNKCFSGESVEAILLSLEKQIENGREEWIVDAINSMKSSTPTGLKLFLRSIRESRRQNLVECLIHEYTVICHVIRRTISNDFYEGVRAKLIEKGKKPEWKPSKLELVKEEMVDRFFERVDEDDWEPLQLVSRARSNLVRDNVVASKL